LKGVSLETATERTYRLSAEEAFHLLLGSNPFCPSSVLLDRRVFERCGYPDLHDPGCGDWDTWLRIARHFPIAVIDQRLTEYRVHDSGSCTNKHFLASGLELTLFRQRSQLHPNCEACRVGFQSGKKHVAGVFAVAARAHLDRYFGHARAGKMS